MEPAVSFCVAGRFNPEEASAEVSPIVSVADTKKIRITEIIAFAWNSGRNGRIEGNAITAVPFSDEKSTTPIHTAAIYPANSPKRTESCLKYDFANMLNNRQQSNVNTPKIQFVAEPNSLLPLPPPNEDAPTESSEKPIAVTTLAATIGVIILVQYFAKRPSTPSTIPPIKTAPTIEL